MEKVFELTRLAPSSFYSDLIGCGARHYYYCSCYYYYYYYYYYYRNTFNITEDFKFYFSTIYFHFCPQFFSQELVDLQICQIKLVNNQPYLSHTPGDPTNEGQEMLILFFVQHLLLVFHHSVYGALSSILIYVV